MKMKQKVLTICLTIIVVAVLAATYVTLVQHAQPSTTPTTTTSVKFVSSQITVNGVVTAQSQAKLNFQIGGKLTYLPFKEGDTIAAGQTLARLDTYALQRQLTATLNTYRTTRDTFDQAQANSQGNVLKPTLAPNNTDAINDAINRMLDQSQAGLDNSVINVELANYALQLSTLTSPLHGIVTHEDVTVPGVNITPLTTFTVADPTTMVFRANVPTSSIYYVGLGSLVTLAIDGVPDKVTGTVVKIYPSKVVLSSGESVYQVDIQSDVLLKNAKLDEGGTAIISTNAQNVALVPAWAVLSGKYIWIDNNGTPELRTVTIGKTHGSEIEIMSGVSASDKIIIDPKFIAARKYQIL